MANKQEQSKAGKEPPKGNDMDWRPWLLRGVVMSILVFAFVSWRLYERLGPMSFLVGLLFVGLIMGWLGVSYYIMNR